MRPVESHTRYLELRLAQCMPRPELHRHQIPVLQELLALARSGISPREYNRRTQHLFGLTRAEWIDRCDNLQAVHAALGDERRVRAAERLRIVGEATNFTELSALMQRAMIESYGIELAAATAADSLTPLMIHLLHWATEGDAHRRAVLVETIKGLWRAIQQSDPGCSWERICSYPPYRNRLPFEAAGLALIGTWLSAAVGTQLADVPRPEPYDPGPLPVIETPDDPPTPSVADTARGFHLAYDQAHQRGEQRSTWPIYERIFAIEAEATCANDFLARLTAADLVCELSRAQYRDIAEPALAHCAQLSQPHVEYHYTSLLAALEACRSTPAIDYEVARHEACFAIESAWHHIFLAYALRTITAALGYELAPSDAQRETVQNSAWVAARLFGDWDRLLGIPPVWRFFREVLWAHGQDLRQPSRVRHGYRGEAGLDLLAAFRGHALEHVVDHVSARDLASPEAAHAEVDRLLGHRFATPEAMREHATGLFRTAIDPARTFGDTAAAPGVVLWGRSVLWDELEGALSCPPRPC